MRSFRLAQAELKRLLSARPFRLAAAVVCVVPLLYGVLYLWAFWNPYARLDKLPVAVVNLDQPVKSSGATLHVGSDLVARLRAGKAFDWRLVSAAQARTGLKDGKYSMTLTIPADFSSEVASAAGSSPHTATLQVQQNEAHNLLATQIGGRVFLELRSSLSAVTSQGYLAKIFAGVTQVKQGMTRAGSGATTLSVALRRAATGSSTLTGGIATAASGTRRLSTGLTSLARGGHTLASGSTRLAGGAGRLASGLSTAAAGASTVSKGSNSLASGAGTLAGGLTSLASGSTKLHSAAATLASGAAHVHSGLTTAAGQTAAAAASAGHLAAGATQVQQALAAYIAAHPDAADLSALQTAAGAAGQVADGLSELHGGLATAAPQLAALDSGAAQLDDGSSQLAASLATYGAAVDQARAGAMSVAGGATALAKGADALKTGVSTTSVGAVALARGARSLTGGTDTLATGASTAGSSGATLVTGLDRLLAGGSRLKSGLLKAQAGGSRLADSLNSGAASVTSYSRKQAASSARTMSDPVQLATQRVDPVPNYGTGFAPYFIPLALWVGALMTYFIVRPLSGRALASTLPDAEVALAGLWPGVVVTSVQAVVLVFVLELALGLHPVQPAALLLFALVSAFAFTAILQFLSAALGTAGKFVAIVLLMLQLTSSAGTFPLQTVPRFFQLINPWLPMTYVDGGLRQAVSGGDLRALAFDTVVLLGFAALGVCATILTAHRRRTWTMDRLKPIVTMQ